MKLLLTIGVTGILLASMSQSVQARDYSSWRNNVQSLRRPWFFGRHDQRVINANELNMNAQIGGLQMQVNNALAAGTMQAAIANVLTSQINALAAQERDMIGGGSLSDNDCAILQASVQNEQNAVTGAITH